jgi:hypothetical protein
MHQTKNIVFANIWYIVLSKEESGRAECMEGKLPNTLFRAADRNLRDEKMKTAFRTSAGFISACNR